MAPVSTPTRARVLFDEAHSEAWSIHPELAERMQETHPADASLAARGRGCLSGATSRSASNDDGPLDADALASADVLVIAHPSDPRWEATTGAGEPRLADEEIEAIAAWVEAGGGLIVLGETEQEKYGNNLERAARPLRDRDRDGDRPGLRAPPRGAELGPGRPRPARRDGRRRGRPAGRRRRGVLLPGRDARGRRRRPRDRADLARRPRRRAAPLAAVTEHGAGPRRRARRLRPVRRRLHRRPRPRGALGEPGLLGRRTRRSRARWSASPSAAAGDPAWARAARRGRGAAADAGAGRLGGSRRARRGRGCAS